MAKASPIIRSFNAGERSPLTEGRTDLDGYPASSRQMSDTVAAPQGPSIARSGTEFMNRVYNESERSMLVPFVFSETDFYMIEFANSRIRFFTETGLLVYAPVAMTVSSASPFQFTSASLNASIGDEVVFSGFGSNYNLNGVTAKITNKVSTTYTVDINYPALALVSASVARVYHVASPYNTSQIADLEDTPSLDVVYLTHPTITPYKLKRFDTYNWVFEVVDFLDGPYIPINEGSTTFSMNTQGKATPSMLSNSTPSGAAFGSSAAAGSDYYLAFDAPGADTFWQSNTDQSGIIGIQLSGAQTVDGYTIYMAINNADTNYTSKDYAPSTWTFEGSNDGSTYTVLDSQENYVLYDNNKSVFFKLDNPGSYSYYRLNIKATVRNGPLKPCVRNLMLRSTTSTSITVTASSVNGINNNQGFLTTDVGRLIRVKGSDGTWRPMKITARSSTTVVTATLLGEPFNNLQPTTQWRLGAWSNTTGFPNTSVFFQDRTWWGGSTALPDLLVMSVSGDYENMAPSTESGEVLDTSAWAGRLNARRLSRIKWLAAGKDGLLIGTGSQEYLVKAGGTNNIGKTITPGNIQADVSSSRGSSNVTPVPIDLQVLYVQRGGRTVREFAYNYEADGYKSPSMSLLANHLGVKPFVQMAYAAEPFSIVWVRRQDGSVVGLTYNRDENVVGWHRHDFIQGDIDGEVESIAVMPSSNQLQDILWMTVKRTINGQTHRYIEKLRPFWDFDHTIDDAWYVDCALRYVGSPTAILYGLQHLEGEEVYGLADGRPIGPFTVTNGRIQLEQGLEASNIVVGRGFESFGETSSLENGAADGTAQGKEKRMNLFTLKVWQSYGGEIGTWNEDTNEIEWVDLDELYPSLDIAQIKTINLYTGILGPFTPAPGYEKRGSVFYRRRKDNTLPFNIVSLMPQLNTQDRG